MLYVRNHPILPILLLFAASIAVASATTTAGKEDVPAPHPDLNDHNHEGMVFIGRLCDRTGRRLSADHDNTIRYVFGTSFVEELHNNSSTSSSDEVELELDASHWSTVIDVAALVHHPTGDVPGSSGHDPHDQHYQHQQRLASKTRAKVLHERQKQNKQQQGPVPFGHVETHLLDGGVVPVVAVAVEPFWIDDTPVTNSAFGQFVRATYYETEAELYGWSFVLSSFIPNTTTAATAAAADTDGGDLEWETDPDAPHWVALRNATWRHPEGPHSSITSGKHKTGSTFPFQQQQQQQHDRAHHPVVHVSHRDAAEFCAWRNKRLPGEREYEAVTRASHWSSSSTGSTRTSHATHPTTNGDTNEHAIHGRTMYAWGNAIRSNDTTTTRDDNSDHTSWDLALHYANLWGAAGPFPTVNDARDGWIGTSPVRTYPPNAMGVYDTTGNVWEWQRGGKNKARIVRGASYVDSIAGDVNHAATLGARAVVHGTTTAGNIGFRCAKAVPKRVEHHWVWHDDEDETHDPTMTVEDDDDLDESDEDEFQGEKPAPRKKKKVVLKPERISTEL